jgi:hypothetical protein
VKVVKEAIGAKAIGDATLVSLLGGGHVFQDTPEIKTDDLAAWVTFWCVSPGYASEIPRLDQLYQFDIWASTSDLADTIAERVSAIYGWKQDTGGGTLSIDGRRLAEPIYEEPASPDMAEPTAAAQPRHHRARQFRVATYPLD